MRLHFLFVILSILPALRSFAFDLEDSIVKIFSAHSYSEDSLQGSGLLIEHEGSYYVLTSEHVLIPNFPIEHQHRILIDGKWERADLLNLDWAAGLALLKIKNPQANLKERRLVKFSEIQSLIPSEIKPADRVVAGGIPLESASLKLSSFGRIENPESQRPLFLDCPTTIEVKGAATEVGMSGGLLINSQRKVLGILAYREYEKDLTYAIPLSFAREWLEKQFNGNNSVTLGRIYFRNRHGEHEPIVTSGEFSFRIFPNEIAIEYIPSSVIPSPSRQIQWDLLNPIRVPRIPVEHVRLIADGLRERYGSLNSSDLNERERAAVQWSGLIASNTGKFFALGFRKKGLENFTTDLMTPKNHIEFFRMARDPSLILIAQYNPLYIDYDNINSDFSSLADELTVAGNLIYTERPLGQESMIKTLRGVSNLLTLLRDERHASLKGQPYGQQLIDYISVKELKEVESQRYCEELFNNRVKNYGLELYRQRIGDLRKFVERFNY